MEEELFVKMKGGNKKSFELLFKSYYAPLCHFANSIINNEDESEELVQNFFVSFWDKRENILIESSVKGYLFQSIKNRCYNFIKHQKIKQKHQQDSRLGAHINYHQHTYTEIGLAERIEESISALPDRRREIFKLSRENGLKYREIADKLGITISTVETQMGHALRELRTKLRHFL